MFLNISKLVKTIIFIRYLDVTHFVILRIKGFCAVMDLL